MKLMSMKQYSKMTKASLVRKIMKALKKMPKTKLARLCYQLEKKSLPKLKGSNFSRRTYGIERDLNKLGRLSEYEAKRIMGGQTLKRYLQGSAIDEAPTIRPKTIRRKSQILRKKARTAKQKANDMRLGRMAKARARSMKRKRRR